MGFGESVGLIVLRVSVMLHGALDNFVSVTNAAVSGGGSELQFTPLSSGADLAQWLADTAQIYVGILGAVADIAGLGADLSKLFTVFLS